MGSVKKEVNRMVGKAIHNYGLLDHGDRIMVAISGGSDSLAMLWFLRHWLSKATISYTLLPVHLDMGFPGHDWRPIRDYLDSQNFSYHFEQTNYGPLAHSSYNREKSPCFLCSMLRRKRLFELAHRLGCNKIALGHNQDDLIETFFMNVLYVGEISTMVPRQKMFNGVLTLIRPLALVEKSKINRMTRRLKLPVIPNACPSAGASRRREIKQLLDNLYKSNRNIRGNIMRSLSHARPQYLLG